MTTLVTITNNEKSNGDVIIDGVSTCEGKLRGVALRPGQTRDVWITTGSALIVTETWPTRPHKTNDPGGGKTISECGDLGEKWAKAFVDHHPAADEDLMRAWFQNAIEASHSVRVERVADEAIRVARATAGEFVPVGELETLREKADAFDRTALKNPAV